MPRFTRTTRVAAPLSTVWSYHSTAAGLREITPDWLGLRFERIESADGTALEPDDEMAVGTAITMSLTPLGIGPRQEWTSEITAMERDDETATFSDRMIEGPFPYWEHTHRFVADGEATFVTDTIDYELPILGDCPGSGIVGRLGLEPLFRYRHWKTRSVLEE